MRVCLLAPLLLCTPLLASERGTAESTYDRHVILDQCLPARAYFESGGMVTAPSSVELIDGEIPLDAAHHHVPGSSLRLSWTSATGGDWRTILKTRAHYGLINSFDGDMLTFWCYSETGLSPQEAPHMHLEDADGGATFTISILSGRGALPAGQWVQIRLPLSAFHGIFRGTDVEQFNLRHLALIMFAQGLDDGRPHTLFISDVQIGWENAAPLSAPPAPTALHVAAGERHLDLKWTPAAPGGVLRYIIYRSWDNQHFEAVGIQQGNVERYTDFVGAPPRTAYYRVSAVAVGGAESEPCAAVSGTTRAFSDDELLTMVQKGCFRYYWEGGHADCGMALEITPGDVNLVAVGASGFGIMAIVAGTERGFVTRDESAARIAKIVHFLKGADRFHGAWPHFLDGRTGKVVPYFGKFDDGGDLVETSFLIQGLLTARSYFDRDTPVERGIRDGITELWRGVEWDWYRRDPTSDFLYWHWSPDHAWYIGHPLIGWNETMIVYLLAIASPTHPVPASLYYSRLGGPVGPRRPLPRGLERHHDRRPLREREELLWYQARCRRGLRREPLLHAVLLPGLRSARQARPLHQLFREQPEPGAHQPRLLHGQPPPFRGVRRRLLGAVGGDQLGRRHARAECRQRDHLLLGGPGDHSPTRRRNPWPP